MLHLLGKHFKLILVWGIIFAVLAGGISFLFPMQYSADSQVLIISRDRNGVDPYTQAKSAERIGDNLAQVMKTTDFYTRVMNTSATFDREQWKNLNDRNQRKKWGKDVQAAMMYGTGIMNLTVYSFSQDDAVNLSNAINQTLSSQGWDYIGGDVAIKIVGSPLVSRWPSRPNIVVNIMLGFVVGALLSSLWVLRYKRHLFGN